MTLMIELTPEQEATLSAEATARGLALPEFARLQLLESACFRKFGTPEEEAADEAAWAERFENSGDLLERLAAEADEEHKNGRTVPLGVFLEKAG